jgi:hypothetical protein
MQDYVRARLGLPPFKPNGEVKRKRLKTTVYEYRNPAGEVVYKKERYEYDDGSKSFQIIPKGRNGLRAAGGPRRRRAGLDHRRRETGRVA